MNYFTKDFFTFKGYSVKKIEKRETDTIVFLKPRRKTATCPKCLKRSKSVLATGKERIAKHSRYESKVILVSLPKRRFSCLSCKTTFSEKPEFLKERARTTANFTSETIGALSKSSFKTVSETYNTNYNFLSKALRSIDFNAPWPKGELRLGVDEHAYGKRKMMITVCELSTRKLLAILPRYTKEAVEEYLSKRSPEEISRVKELCFDMGFKQQGAVESFFPSAITVIDKFHVLAYLSYLIDADRRLICPNIGRYKYENLRQVLRKPKWRLTEKQSEYLDKIFTDFPELKERWDIYQKLVLFYGSTDREQGRLRLREVIDGIEKLDKMSYLKSFAKTLIKMEEDILNYFVSRTTNAFTEGVHTKIKMIKRTSFGFRNMDIYIKKMMLSFLPISVISSIFLPH